MANDSDQTNSTSNHNLFRLNYKFINFQKSADKNDCKAAIGESILDFYQDLIRTEDQNEVLDKQCIEKEDSDEIIEITKSDDKKIDPSQFLKACQNSDLETVAKYISKSGDILCRDPYEWNCIMISIVSFCNQILSFILENIKDKNILDQLLTDQDLSGSTAESLSQKVKNTGAIELINKAKEKFEKKTSDLPIINEPEFDKDSQFFCESCDTSHREHTTSIVHLINENACDLEKNQRILTNYHLRSNNIGYQLMIKSGWNERGLGSKEQGRTVPIKARQKLDRLGIGVEKKTKTYTRPLVNIKLKSSKNDSSMLRKAKTLKDTIKENERAQKYERNLRRYFDL
ncbi:G patch domain and ankyrin repeat-containing 1 -like protein [Brachionus plicatilis]|uniref:G patch domain and ankyrin repeat-containing 1-like protein n=1 Tax=Brachionus plicatilis TaxID=10195 RepID=A0A3M7PIL1_BRAPC|nr:G patch domain and ankyrin repeat-containing 1 -like protein [Brachionus plicatilis]